MIEATVGQSFTALIEGLAPGLVTQLTFAILRTDGTVAVAATTAGITEIDPPSGNYAAVSQSPEAGGLLVEWVVPATNDKYIEDLTVRAADASAITVYDGYPDTATIVALSSVTELISLPLAEQDVLRRQAISSVEEYCQQGFENAVATKNIDGSGSQELYLPTRLERLDQISARGAWWPGGMWSADEFATVDIDTVQLSDDHFRLELSQVIPNYAVQAMDWGDQPYKRLFPSGPDSIQITGLWGWPSVPQPVIDAIRIDMEDTALADANQLTSTIRAYRKLGLTQIRQGNLSGVLSNSGDALSAAAQRLLRPYVHPGLVGSMA